MLVPATCPIAAEVPDEGKFVAVRGDRGRDFTPGRHAVATVTMPGRSPRRDIGAPVAEAALPAVAAAIVAKSSASGDAGDEIRPDPIPLPSRGAPAIRVDAVAGASQISRLATRPYRAEGWPS